jgi:hypothetical protein
VIIKEACACAAIMADRTALGPIRRPVAVAVGVRSGPPVGLPSSRGRRPDRVRQAVAGPPTRASVSVSAHAATIGASRSSSGETGAASSSYPVNDISGKTTTRAFAARTAFAWATALAVTSYATHRGCATAMLNRCSTLARLLEPQDHPNQRPQSRVAAGTAGTRQPSRSMPSFCLDDPSLQQPPAPDSAHLSAWPLRNILVDQRVDELDGEPVRFG